MMTQTIFHNSDYVLMQYRGGFKALKNRHGVQNARITHVESKNLLSNNNLRVLVINQKGAILTSNFDVVPFMRDRQDERYFVEQISRKDALEKLVNHPIKRNPQVVKAFGLFDKDRGNRLVGVITYGNSASPTLCKGLCGEEERLNVAELNRLWAETSVSNNALVFFVTETFSLQEKEIIVTFTQPDDERTSRLLRLVGFYYTGLTKLRTQRVNKDGSPSPHHRTNCYMTTTTHVVPAPRKHRFVYFHAQSDRKHELFEKLNYEVVPY